jgi:cobalt-zinc-cadmium efflux system membrane fusion protein
MKNIIFCILSLLVLISCSAKKEKETKTLIPHFCLPDSLMSQIKPDTVTLKPVANELRLIGKVTFDQDKVVRIFPLVSGNVVEVKVSLGSYVKKGEILAILKSPEMAGAQNEQVSAQSNLAITEKNFAATSDMFKSGIVSDKEFTAAQKELDKAKSELNRIQTVLSIYGDNGQSEYVVRSPISGYIVEKFINANMQIRPDNSTSLFTISDLRHVWVVANVYESDIAGIRENANVEVTTISYPGKVFTGKIDKIYNVLDPDDKTMKIQIQLNNDDFLLKPEMFATVTVHQVDDNNMLSIPASSVIFDRNQNWVLVYRDKCDIQIRKIDIASSNSKYTYIRSGLKLGELVISNRQVLIYNAITQ